MPDDAPHFDTAGRLVAPKYDDIYFSAEDGLAETQHVFLKGNQLAERFAALPAGGHFTIGETGFGTGLNFLAAWQLFEQQAPNDATLDFVSVEGFPLDAEQISQALLPWSALAEKAEAMLAQWGAFWPGAHRLRFASGRVGLTLLIGEVAEAMSSVESNIDAWFLDGFAPSRNPAMWSDELFAHLARSSREGTTLATYTAAGFVRRGLQGVGFDVEKQLGFGTKRDMTAGTYTGNAADAPLAVACNATRDATEDHIALQATANKNGTALIIGASIAGAFAARALAEGGVHITVLERQAMIDHALPTLSPRVAVLQPKINDINDAVGQWLRTGYADAYRLLSSDSELAEHAGWQACGTFQAAHNGRSTRRLRRFIDQFGHTGLCRWIEPEQTESETGVALPVGGVLIERAGMLRPAGLCTALLNHPLIKVKYDCPAISLQRDGKRWSTQINSDDPITTDCVIVANAMDAAMFDQTKHLELKPVRGQASLVGSAGQASRLTCLRRPIFYGGYVLPVVDEQQTLGASFIPGDADTQWRDQEHADVCEKLARLLPEEAERLRGIDQPTGWVGLRATTPKHRCFAEQIQTGLYVSLGHGSHGIASAAAAGQHLASLITNGVRDAR